VVGWPSVTLALRAPSSGLHPAPGC
jgi:hypothetical protein